jgi:hypothetical protein
MRINQFKRLPNAKTRKIALSTCESAKSGYKRWIAPTKDYARLQIARLETIAFVLKDKAKEGDLPTIDRLLKVLDRLDRYHGFNKLAAFSTPSREDVRAKLIAKINQAVRASEQSE